jgi:hypothetical protein
LLDAPPFNVTVAPTFTVWFGPAFATGATNAHCRLEKVKSTERSTRMVNVLLLVT